MSLLSSKHTVEDVFGKIQAPSPIAQFNQADQTGTIGISNFLNATITLIYAVAAITVVFMLLWGALEWILSGGDQEKLENAQKRITNAIIGIVILAIVFAILDLLGIFTGFKFFQEKAHSSCTEMYSVISGSCTRVYSPTFPCSFKYQTVDMTYCTGAQAVPHPNCSPQENYNTSTKRCEPKCVLGQYYDPAKNSCIPVCPAGQVFDTATLKCK